MKAPTTFGRKLALGFGLSAAMLLIVAAVSFWSAQLVVDANRQASHTQEVLRALASVVSTVKDAETGQRGYLLTGDATYLEPYTAAAARWTDDLRALEALYASESNEGASERTRLDALRTDIGGKFAELRRTIDLRGAGDQEGALRAVKTNEGKALMDRIRARTGELEQSERDAVRARSSAAVSSSERARAFIVLVAAGALVFVTAAGLSISRALARDVGSAVLHLQSSSTELQAAANQQATASREQATSATEVGTTVHELVASSRQIGEGARRVARTAEETASATAAGITHVDEAKEALVRIRRQVERVVTHMLELGRRTQQVGGVVDIVNELAEQTNILAINATIESAGAGEAGLRFGVVADEIRRLAGRVGGSVREVRTLVEDIRAASNATVMATEEGMKAVEAGVQTFAHVTTSFDDISAKAEGSTEAAREIELSTQQQITAVEQINIAIVHVAQAARETEAGSREALATSTQLAALSRTLTELIRPTNHVGS